MAECPVYELVAWDVPVVMRNINLPPEDLTCDPLEVRLQSPRPNVRPKKLRFPTSQIHPRMG